ncbi:Hypothetical predicted protein [Mytilus galloprovincialis]|uniref:Integrase catalytic domain-containing protein n=1 Tax=Mytilus galloprovincialis TaxID=29158 RepID=A0A8B6HCX1_MYTGA|nr:Hypothetical predicted protein [Mytilus galloprovincialis]
MKDKKVIYPPFECFAEFLREQSKIKKNPSFMYEYDSVVTNRKEKGNSRHVNVSTKKTELQGNSRSTEKSRDEKQCPIHNTNHTLNKCRAFRKKPIDERRKLLKDKNICFRCCESNTHIQRNCPSSGTVKCDICISNHATALHVDNFQRNFNTPPKALSSNGGESLQNPEPNSTTPVVKAICSQVCGDYFSGKSCVQNRSLMKPELSALLNAQGDEITYTLSSCSGKVNITEKTIGAVTYLSAQRSDHDRQYGFVLGKAKVAPSHGHTIPRLEFCAAVLAIELAESVTEHLDIPPEKFRFFTDSKAVLGYISNDSRRFYTYVANRVAKIRKFSKASQWSYVHTGNNPADQASRSIAVNDLQTSMWLHGQTRTIGENSISETEYQLQDPSEDKEVRNVSCLKTKISDISNMGYQRFDRFSDWNKLVGTIARLQHIVDSYQGKASCHHGRGWHLYRESLNLVNSRRAEINIIKAVQAETYTDELLSCVEAKSIQAKSPLVSLNPFVDQEGILRVGGRLSHADIEINEKHPIIIPGKHHIATLLIRKFHHQVKHQGRLITNGVIRTGGYWITGSKRIVSSMIHKCIICRKLRGKLQFQKMADLPFDRLEPGPPFTYVGVDCFGPWEIVTRKTRGGAANSKRWAALFTCLTTRGIHIEVLEEMNSSSFINAFRRFTSIRGQVEQIRSDCRTNFVGATNELKIDTIRVDDDNIKNCLYKSGVTWVFNAPHSSHMGGIWERMIGGTRRVLDSILLENVKDGLTHEVLITLMTEVTAIVNSRPLVEV